MCCAHLHNQYFKMHIFSCRAEHSCKATISSCASAHRLPEGLFCIIGTSTEVPMMQKREAPKDFSHIMQEKGLEPS